MMGFGQCVEACAKCPALVGWGLVLALLLLPVQALAQANQPPVADAGLAVPVLLILGFGGWLLVRRPSVVRP